MRYEDNHVQRVNRGATFAVLASLIFSPLQALAEQLPKIKPASSQQDQLIRAKYGDADPATREYCVSAAAKERAKVQAGKPANIGNLCSEDDLPPALQKKNNAFYGGGK